ncbi:hypothetical protein P5U49_000262 [Neisseria gonorrhoeae]
MAKRESNPNIGTWFPAVLDGEPRYLLGNDYFIRCTWGNDDSMGFEVFKTNEKGKEEILSRSCAMLNRHDMRKALEYTSEYSQNKAPISPDMPLIATPGVLTGNRKLFELPVKEARDVQGYILHFVNVFGKAWIAWRRKTI